MSLKYKLPYRFLMHCIVVLLILTIIIYTLVINPELTTVGITNLILITMDQMEYTKLLNLTDTDLSDSENITIPGSNHHKNIYIMNTIYLTDHKLISIHLLGNRYWESITKQYKDSYIDWNKYLQQKQVDFFCIFQHNAMNLISLANMVPEVLYFHGDSTITLLCDIPRDIITQHLEHNNKYIHQFVLITTDKLINIRLSYNIKQRSVFPLKSKYKSDINNSKHKRLLSICMPSIIDPMPFITETVAYHISQGIEHIYIGTYFKSDKVEKNTKMLINLLKPWYDSGQVTLMNFVMPSPINIDAKYHGQIQFTIQCLYLAKSFGDEFTFNIDADEFIMFHNNNSIYHNLKYKYYEDVVNKCWIIFNSYNVWKLTNPNSNYMVQRYSEIDIDLTHLPRTCKAVWNNKYLWSAEVHTGGACNINNEFGFNWTQQINNYKHRDFKEISDDQRITDKKTANKLVKIMDVKYEASIRHFGNGRFLRYLFVPKEYSMDDGCGINEIIWKSIESEYKDKSWSHVATFEKHDEYDLLYKRQYIRMYGKNKSMEKIISTDFDYKRFTMDWKTGSNVPYPPMYDGLVHC